MEYTKEKGTGGQKGIYYEQDVTAFISLVALKKSEDFCLISNPPNCAPFDDIILCSRIADRNTVHLFQIKYKCHAIAIGDSEFIKNPKSKLHFESLYEKYRNSIEEIKKIIPPCYIEACNFNFIIFTNRSLENSKLFDCVEENVFATNNVKVHKLKEACLPIEDLEKRIFMQSIAVYSQQTATDIKKTSNSYIKSYFNAEDGAAEEIAGTYFNCVKNWWELETKKDVLTKEYSGKLLMYSTFKKFAVPIDTYDESAFLKYGEILHENSMSILWETIKSSNPRISSRHIQFILGNALKDFQGVNVNTAMNYEKIIQDSALKTANKNNQLKYFDACLSGKLPFILQDFSLEVTETFLRYFKFVFIESKDCRQDSLRINENLLRGLKEQFITTKSGQSFNVADIIMETLHEASISGILSLIFDTINESGYKTEDFIPRRINKVVLDERMFWDENQSDVFIIYGDCDYKFIEHFSINLNHVYHFKDEDKTYEYYLERKNNIIEQVLIRYSDNNQVKISLNKQIKYIIAADETVKIKTPSSGNYHFIKLFLRDDKFVVEWLTTNGNIENIRKYKLNKLCQVIQDEISRKNIYEYNCDCCVSLDNISNSFLIISGGPGIGKTILLKQFARTFPTNDFILFVNLKGHYEYFEICEKNSTKSNAEQHLHNFCNDNSIRNFFARKLAKHEIIILLDGFDEIASRYTDIVTKIIREIRMENFKIILTTRTVLKNTVENLFGTFTYSLTSLNKQDQNSIILSYCEKFVDVRVIYSTYNNIIMNYLKKDIEFFNVPFNLQLISKVIVNKIQSGDYLPWNYDLNLFEFYEKFKNYKLEIFAKINKNVNTRIIESYHKYFSIKHLFNKLPNYEIIGDRLNNKLEDYSVLIKSGDEKVGILIDDIDEILFIHQTVAEYFSAKWLFEVFVTNPQLDPRETQFAKYIIKIINNNDNNTDDGDDYKNIVKFPMIRLFFDSMINQNELHQNASENNYKFIREILTTDIDNATILNKFNRNLLFTIILNNSSYYHKRKIVRSLFQVVTLLIQKVPNILTQKDFSEISIQDYVEQKTSNKGPLIIITYKTPGGYFVYYNREFQLWELFRSENLHNSNIRTLLDILQIGDTKVASIFDAARNKHYPVIRQFYVNKIHIVDLNSNQKHLHHFAAEGGSLDIIKLLNLRGKQGKMNSIDYFGRSPAHYAVISGNLELVKYLKVNKLDFKLYDKKGISPFHYAVIFDKKDIVEYLLEDIDINFPTKCTYLPIQYAAALCNNEIFELLLEKGADINSNGKRIIHLITYTNSEINCEFENYVISCKDENNNEINKLLETQKEYNNKCFDFIKFLFQNGVDLNPKVRDITPFAIAVIYENKKLTNFFLQNFANINFISEYGCTALHLAAFKNNVELLKLFLNADINVQDNKKNSVFHFALQDNQNCFETVDFLIKSGANPNCGNYEGITPLHLAVQYNQLEVAKLLIQHTDLNAQNIEGDTALHYAVYYDCIEIVQCLIGKEADINLSNKKRQTALDIAFMKKYRWNAKDRANQEITLYLQKKNATANFTTHNEMFHYPLYNDDIHKRLIRFSTQAIQDDFSNFLDIGFFRYFYLKGTKLLRT